MPFEVIDAASRTGALALGAGRAEARLWPIYQTAELLMCRVEIGPHTTCSIEGSELSYFVYVEAGAISIAAGKDRIAVQKGEGVELGEGVDFMLSVDEAGPHAALVVVAGSELLPGSFFNSLSSAYA